MRPLFAVAALAAFAAPLHGASFVATGLAYQADLKCHDCFFPITPFIAGLGVVFTGLTTVAGGAIGMASQRDVWERVRVPR